MAKILLVGTFHFHESDIDFFCEKNQRQLQEITERFARFAPDAIAIEAAAHAQSDVDAGYAKFSLDDLSDEHKMREDTLGTINVYGATHPMDYKNEHIQINFRLGKMLGHERLHATDDDSISEDIPLPAEVQEKCNRYAESMTYRGKPDDLRGQYLFINTNEWSHANEQLYYLINTIGAGEGYEGTAYNAQWHERNLRIFANIQASCGKYERIFVLSGAGHLALLRRFLTDCDGMELVDVREYL